MLKANEIQPHLDVVMDYLDTPELQELLFSMVRARQQEVRALKVDELSDEMKLVTREYFSFVNHMQILDEYGLMAASHRESQYLRDFVRELNFNFMESEVLVVGVRLGGIVSKLLMSETNPHLVDYSGALLNYCKSFLPNFKKDNIHHTPLLDFSPPPSTPQPYHGILVDSALQHHNKLEVYALLGRFYQWLKPGGVLLFRLKRTQHGKVYMVSDGVGDRFYTSWTDEELKQLLYWLDQLGFEVISHHLVPHKDAVNGQPAFYQFLVRKKLVTKDINDYPN